MNYPIDIRRYNYDPRSPFYEDFSEGLEELTGEQLSNEAAYLAGLAEDPDVNRHARHNAEKRLKAVKAEQLSRLTEEMFEQEEGM